MSWSMIGMCGEKVKQPKPTMVLNFTKCEAKARRSLVIHEFGHSLGLGHEHQRVEFWENVEPHINLEMMTDDERVRKPISDVGVATIGADWRTREDGIKSTLRKIFHHSPDLKMIEFDYDPDSIMHYG